MKIQILSLIAITSLILGACGSSTDETVKTAKGGKTYGGQFTFMSTEKVDNLFPASSISYFSQRVTGQMFESLLQVDPESFEVVPGLAESFSVSDNGLSYTFKIRSGVYFHDDPCFRGKGREVNAEDVKYALEFACSGLELNQMSYLLVNHIVGAKEFYDKTKGSLSKDGIKGIVVKNKGTLEITLVEPNAGFETILTHPNLAIFPREAYEKYGAEIVLHPVGTGPFMLESMDANGIKLKRNSKYWKKDEFGNQLPFLSTVEMKYAKEKHDELLAFRKKEIDVVLEIPVEQIENILGTLKEAQEGKNVKHKVETTSSMSMHYIGLAHESEEFKNPNVRRAFNLALNRQEIVDDYMRGEGWAATNGFVPPMPGYPTDRVKGLVYNPDKARTLLASAGYPNGKNFPSLDFYVNTIEGSGIHNMAIGVKEQLKKELNIELNIVLCSFNEREEAIRTGKAKIWRSGWIADYPDAQNFLSVVYTGNNAAHASMVNSMRYHSPTYDALYERALKENKEDKRINELVRCDQMIIDEAVLLPVHTDDFAAMVNMRVRGFKVNALKRLDFSTLYIKELPE